MPCFGAHVSIAGGVDEALRRGRRIGCDVVQIFTSNARGWAGRAVTAAEAARVDAARRETGIDRVIAHAGYLINLAAPSASLWTKSIAALVEELARAEAIGATELVVHPGAHTGAGEGAGLARIVRALDEVCRRAGAVGRRGGIGRCRIVLETTAGQGTVLGSRFEQIRAILDDVSEPRRFAVCFDTCHAFAAGYDLRTRAAVEDTLDAFDRAIGLRRLAVFHLNDALTDLGSRIDRHAHIGKGRIGLAGFRALVRDRRFRDHPMIIETPKGGRREGEWDRRNLKLLRSL
jgi:deoxyribonuclease-4